MKVNNLIIGAGITGLTYANYCKGDYLIIEKAKRVGGYCKTTIENGFVWDYAGHFFHFKTNEFKDKFMHSLSKDDYVTQMKKTYIYYDNNLIDYPFQMNIHQLKKSEFIDCLYDLFNKEEKETYSNFLDMLYGKFGKSITEKFLKPYNEKLYACDLKKLDKEAMGRFFPYADIKSIISNMKSRESSSYNSTFLYPKRGAQVIIDILMENIDKSKIMCNCEISCINLNDKKVKLNNGTIIEYENLINTIPFNNFLNLFNKEHYTRLSEKLSYNKVLVFNLGFDKKSSWKDIHWVYFPDKSINFYRVGFYDNILNSDKLSMYIEIGYSKDAVINNKEIENQLKNTIKNLGKVGIIDDSFNLLAKEVIIMNPAYVHIDTKTKTQIDKLMLDLANNDVYSLGRYGAWTYCSMEDCMISARELAKRLK